MSVEVCEELDAYIREESGGNAWWGHPFVSGAAAAFGLMGMGEAIRQWGREQEFARLMSFVRDDDVCPHDDGTDPDEPADRGFVCAICTADHDRSADR